MFKRNDFWSVSAMFFWVFFFEGEITLFYQIEVMGKGTFGKLWNVNRCRIFLFCGRVVANAYLERSREV